MSPPPGAEAPAWRATGGRKPGKRALLLLWPAFLMAGVLEALVFAVVDPMSLHGFGSEPLGWSASAVYSVTFLVFWCVIAASGAITQMLEAPGPDAAPARSG